MTREELEQRLAEYVDGSLAPAEEAAVEEQLAADPELAERLADLKRLLPIVHALPEEQPPAELTENIFRATTRRRGLSRLFRWESFNRMFTPAAAVATVLLVAIIGLAVFSMHRLTGRNESEQAFLLTKQESAEDLPQLPGEAAKPADEARLGGETGIEERLSSAETMAKDTTTAEGMDEKKGEALVGLGGEQGGAGKEVGDKSVAKSPASPLSAPSESTTNAVFEAKTDKTFSLKRKDEIALQKPAAASGKVSVALDELFGGSAPPAPRAGGTEGPGVGAARGAGEVDSFKLKEARKSAEVESFAPEAEELVDADEQTSEKAVETKALSDGEAAGLLDRWDSPLCRLTDETTMIVTDPDAWTELWTTVHAGTEPMPDVPDLDFAEVAVIGVFLGERRSGGYAVSVLDVQRDGNAVQLRVRETTPGAQTGFTTVLTQPCSLVVVPRHLDGLEITPETVLKIVK